MKILPSSFVATTAALAASDVAAVPSFPSMTTPEMGAALDCSSDVSPTSTDPRERMCYYVQYNRENFDILLNLPLGFHNHLSYYIVALWRLGANATRMDGAFEELSPDLCPPAFPSQGLITADNWKEYIGMNASQLSSIHFFDYRDYYQQQIAERGADEVFLEVFPEVVDGLVGDLLHGIIETSYAVEANDTVVLADGLAWLSTAYAPLPDMNPEPPGSNDDPVELLMALGADEGLPKFPGNEVGNIKGTLAELQTNYSQRLSQYDLYLGDSSAGYDYVGEAMRKVAEAVLLLFASDGYKDFFIVHLVTSTRAVETLLPMVSEGWGAATTNALQLLQGSDEMQQRLDTQKRAVAAIWKAVTYVYVSRGSPPISESLRSREGMVYPDPEGTWVDIVERTIDVPDTHLQKIVLLFRSNYYNRGRDPLNIHAALKAVEFFEAGADSHRGRWFGEGDPKPKHCDVSKFMSPPRASSTSWLRTHV